MFFVSVTLIFVILGRHRLLEYYQSIINVFKIIGVGFAFDNL